MLKILLPFKKKNALLKDFWWHRLCSVLFFPAVIGVFVECWYTLNKKMYEPYYSCINQRTGGHNWFGLTSQQYCQSFYPNSSSIENYLLPFVIAIAFFYLIQFIYYKGLVYIIKGDN